MLPTTNSTLPTEFTELIIDEEFKALVPPHRPEELKALEEDVLKNGVKDSIKVWKGHGIILDGMSRHIICMRENLPFPIEYIDLRDREAAKVWILSWQLARRNVTDEMYFVLLGMRYKAERASRGGNRKPPKSLQGNGNRSKVRNEPLIDTATRLAKETGASRSKVKRAAKFVEEHPEGAKAVLAGESSIREVKQKAAEVSEEKEPKAARKKMSRYQRFKRDWGRLLLTDRDKFALEVFSKPAPKVDSGPRPSLTTDDLDLLGEVVEALKGVDPGLALRVERRRNQLRKQA
jgi:hypothetical protein